MDARGLLVAPGFVDIHTHYDGQVMWDSRLAPSSLHGVTTAVMGNCGVGFAPVRATDREKLIELMEGVEDIPGVVLREGLSWAWESFGDYLNIIDGRRYDMDVAAQLPHAPLRVFVMGERACRLEPATEDDITRMRALARDAVRAGAIGFSTSRSLNHRTVKGDPTPSLKASEAELLGIAMGIVDAGGGVIEIAAEFPAESREQEFAMVRRIAAATGLPLSFGLSQKNSDPDGWKDVLRLIDEAQAAGVRISAQVTPRPVGAIINVGSSLNPFLQSPTYRDILAAGPLEDAFPKLRQSEVEAKVLDEAGPLVTETLVGRMGGFDRLFVQHGIVNYEPDPAQSVGRLAAASSRLPLELLYDLLHAEGGGYVYFPVMNYTDYHLEPVREMLQHSHTVMGLGDGGAHVGIIADASFPTDLITRWTRDNRADGFDLSWLIKRQTSDTARLVGMTDRGIIAPGLKADINIIDLKRLDIERPMVVHDLPAGGQRLLQGASGYVATLVSGQAVYRDGEATGALPGRLVKGKAAAA
jgi:N-acyl-D-aspartate/D-glutamate deacylase